MMIDKKQAIDLAKTLNGRDLCPFKECPKQRVMDSIHYHDCNSAFIVYKADCAICGPICKGKTPNI